MANSAPSAKLHAFSRLYQDRVNTYLKALIDEHQTDGKRLLQAMNYSLLSGGKRVRPLLTYASALAVSTKIVRIDTIAEPTLEPRPEPIIDGAASAVECIHAYSLIHDDLPAMDNDGLRRGKPTCHIAYDEATAILAGDALQTLAFELLANMQAPAEILLELIRELSHASGSKGMVIGQMMDITGSNSDLKIEQLERVHRHKTGALIEAAVIMGAIAGGCKDASAIERLRTYAINIGLAFQVRDDILDVTTDTHTLGKQQGADEALNKSTYVSLLGLEAAQEKCEQLLNNALEALKPFGPNAQYLHELALYIVHRGH